MKKVVLLVSVILVSLGAFSQNGTVIENQIHQSKIVDYDVNYSVYLPPCYSSSERAYPVIYLLHGYTDNETAWVQYAFVNNTMDKLIAEGKMPPAIIIMPDAKVTWYVNSYDAKDRYMDMFIQEFIPAIESKYRIRGEKRHRAISGLSMGGHGALLYAVKYPEIFGACAAFSAAVYTQEEMQKAYKSQRKEVYEPIYGPLTDDGSVPQHFLDNSVLEIVANADVKPLKTVRYYIDCGDDDFLYRGNSSLHILMRNKGIPHQYRVRDGEHSWVYWRTYISNGLVFMGELFSNTPATK